MHHLDPQFLNYPSFLIYLTAIANYYIHLFDPHPVMCETYIAARTIVAIFGALTAIAAFLLAEEISGTLLAAFLAGLFVALLPLDVWNSHFAATDIPMTFWIIMALYASVRLIKTQKTIDFIFAGIAIGLGTASKYTAALVAIAPFIAVIILILTLAYTSIFTYQTTKRFRYDTRIAAEKWLDHYLKPGQSILLCGYHYYLAMPENKEINVHVTKNNCVAIPHKIISFDLIEITSLHYARYLRQKQSPLRFAYKKFRNHPDFKLVERFESHFINKRFYELLDPMFGGYFVSPTLEFYKYAPHQQNKPIIHNSHSISNNKKA